jgi:lipopolysaccharide/colanic/teichoic acid biosynthesis glycosyltransferase
MTESARSNISARRREEIAPGRAGQVLLYKEKQDVALVYEFRPKGLVVEYPDGWWGERVFDIVGAIMSAVLLLPVFVTVGAAIRLSGAPIFFGHERIGRGGKSFKCFKFRSMIPDAERVLQDLLRSDPGAQREWERSHKLQDDPRITKFGSFLRKSSLDELPQLWNVLKGEMSLVGPRPIVEDEVARYGKEASMYKSVRPGMTGLWQVIARSNCTYSRRVSLDKLYVKNKSITLDIWILWKTVGAVLKRVGAV